MPPCLRREIGRHREEDRRGAKRVDDGQERGKRDEDRFHSSVIFNLQSSICRSIVKSKIEDRRWFARVSY
jgi:hypothetical protein